MILQNSVTTVVQKLLKLNKRVIPKSITKKNQKKRGKEKMKIKVNFKLLIALGIVLLALFTFNISTVSAAATANSLDKVPDIIEVGIATTDAIQDGYMSDKLSDILYTKVIESIADKDISAKQVTVSFVHEKLLDMAEV